MVESSSSSNLPAWLQSLLSEKFFTPCMIHQHSKKNERNIFCLDCCASICHHCLDHHSSHRLLQIRRYVYHDVIRVGDAEKLMDCSFVQAYTTNSAKVVFLNPRPQTRACRNLSNNCISCERGLQDQYHFCSISCKGMAHFPEVKCLEQCANLLGSNSKIVYHIMRNEGVMSNYLYECEVLTLPDPGSDDWIITPDMLIEPFVSPTTSSGSIEYTTTATTEIVRKKRTTKFEIPAAAAPAIETAVSRRKGMPRRSPFN